MTRLNLSLLNFIAIVIGFIILNIRINNQKEINRGETTNSHVVIYNRVRNGFQMIREIMLDP